MEDKLRGRRQRILTTVIILAVISLFLHLSICNREANMVAHELARLARFHPPLDWFEEPLDKIVTFLTKDVLVVSKE